MNEDRLDLIKSKIKAIKVEYDDVNGTLRITPHTDNVFEACEILKNDMEISFDMLVDAVSVDRFTKQNRFEMIYNLYSNKFRDRIFIRIKLDSKEPMMHTLSGIWKSADWYEREAFDMMGIKFINHPDLRRVYLPEEFEYYPLRKDFPLMGITGSLPLPNK
jgi:NADH-quinone oxidoreductase subunit C